MVGEKITCDFMCKNKIVCHFEEIVIPKNNTIEHNYEQQTKHFGHCLFIKIAQTKGDNSLIPVKQRYRVPGHIVYRVTYYLHAHLSSSRQTPVMTLCDVYASPLLLLVTAKELLNRKTIRV